MLQFEVDRKFNEIVARLADDSRPSLFHVRLVALAAAVGATYAGLTLPDLHVAAYVAWWTIGTPALVLAAIIAAERVGASGRLRLRLRRRP